MRKRETLKFLRSIDLRLEDAIRIEIKSNYKGIPLREKIIIVEYNGYDDESEVVFITHQTAPIKRIPFDAIKTIERLSIDDLLSKLYKTEECLREIKKRIEERWKNR